MKRELLFSITKKDFDIDYFSGTGAGGQFRNRHMNCVRIHHKASGSISTGQSSRSRKDNLKEALHGLVENPKFKLWHAMTVQEKISGKTIDEKVDEQMKEENLKIEKKVNNKWISI